MVLDALIRRRSMSYELKEKGNLLFKEGDYNGAEELYSLALVTRSLARKKKKRRRRSPAS